ncbi:MAG: hypothetical protein HOB82_08145 [Alphaproteobacteria bacterium]|jgi:hypothetical protein|nr:hypothetical protein [Alphaproteobacteria bacterium]MBT4711482.1 hypothetical protein [Alphaproteobacteria bacterium]MBT5860167.1 hypothetical protein [Alphaproteobacteria bacterium]
MNNRALWGFVAAFAVVTVVARLVPHMPNVAPVAALALFMGLNVRKNWMMWLLVPGVLVISDVFIGFYNPGIMAAVYASFLAIVGLGAAARKFPRIGAVAGGSVAGSTVFFVVTNLAVWAFSGMYAPTMAGLTLCYVLALPFYGYMLVGDLAWNAVFSGSYGLYQKVARRPLRLSRA